MDDKLNAWIKELRHYNGKLHLMGPAMLDGIEDALDVMLPLLKHIDEPVLADLGSGSGLPAIPCKILHPDSRIYMIERSAKKCTFLRHTIEVLGLDGVEILQSDPLIMDIGKFDAVVARSFSPLLTLRQVCHKMLRDNGRLYYLFTGSMPDLTDTFQLKDMFSQEKKGLSLNLAVFSHLP